MRAIIQLAKLVNDESNGRGLIREIADSTGLERHAISAMLHNRAKYVSLESVGRLCDYLIARRGVDPAVLPGAIFGKAQDGFWSMLADRTHVHFSLATRMHPEWPENQYVMANDSHLQGVVTAQVSALDPVIAKDLDDRALAAQTEFGDSKPTSDAEAGPDDDSGELPSVPDAAPPGPQAESESVAGGDAASCESSSDKEVAVTRDARRSESGSVQRVFINPHLLPAPQRTKEELQGQAKPKWKTLTRGKARAEEIYSQCKMSGEASVHFALGSVKVNGVVEVMVADIFKATPFRSQDGIAVATDRACPFYFRYRAYDPTPDSLCGGTQLAKSVDDDRPGIYYENEDGDWVCCPCVPDEHDVAFVLYAFRPPVDQLQVACGGFSGVASSYLAERFVSVASQLWQPQFRSPELEVGLFLVTFDIRRAGRGRGGTRNSDFNHRVIRVHEDVLARRLGDVEEAKSPKKGPRRRRQ